MWKLSVILISTFTSTLCSKIPDIYPISGPTSIASNSMWDPRTNSLFFNDHGEQKLYRYDYNTSKVYCINLGGYVSPILLTESDPDILNIGLNLTLVELQWDGVSSSNFTITNLTTFQSPYPDSILNRGKADDKQRLWIGAYSPSFYPNNNCVVNGNLLISCVTPHGAMLYEVSSKDSGKPKVIEAGINFGTGLTFDTKYTRLYNSDFIAGQVIAYDFNSEEEVLSNKRVFFELRKQKSFSNAYIDGMTIDADDNLWIAAFQAAAVVQIDHRTQEIIRSVAIPESQVASLMWGGPNLDILYIGTGNLLITEEELQEHQSIGCVFAVVGLGTKGVVQGYVKL